MVLTPEEQAELERLTAKAAEPEPAPPARKVVTIAADALEVVRQLVAVHWASIAGAAASEINRAIGEATDEPAAEPEPSEEA